VKVLTEEDQEIQIKEEDEDVKEMAKELGLEIEAPTEVVYDEEADDVESGENTFDEEDEEFFEDSFEEDLTGEV
jgi:DNA-directed RNA polymerase subunit beta